MPCFNSSKYISKSIESVIQQTYENIELIIIDDCSTDNSLSIINDFISKDKRIKLIKLEKNSGAAIARNKGIEVANGKFIAFIDSDDYWLKDKLKIQVTFMIKHSYSFSFCNLTVFDEVKNSYYLPKESNKISVISFNDLLFQNLIGTSSVLIDVSKLNKFEMPLMKSGQDYATWLLILKRGILAYGLRKNLVIYTKRKNSLSSNKFKSIKQVFYIHTKIIGLPLFLTIFNIILFIINTSIKKIKLVFYHKNLN